MKAEDLEARVRAGERVMVWRTGDEESAIDLAEDLAGRMGLDARIWSHTEDGGTGAPDLEGLLVALSGRPDGEIWVALDPAWESLGPKARRRLRDRLAADSGPVLVLVQPVEGGLSDVPDLPCYELPPPSAGELAGTADAVLRAAGLPLDWADAVGQAGVGLSYGQFRRLLSRLCFGARWKHRKALVAAMVHEKSRAMIPQGAVAFAPTVPLDALGGLDGLKAWLRRRARAFDPAAHAAGIPWPRGILLLGPPGCGKSLAAKAVPEVFGIPLVRLDPGRLYGGTVGASESNLRRALAVLDRAAPVAVWIDEIEKGFAGTEGARSDAGTSARVLGTFLTWLEERNRPVVVVATANRVAGIPPELIRPGRFDATFFVDLPDGPARREILDVHLRREPKRRLGYVPPLADPVEAFLALAEDAEGSTGADLAAAVTEARLLAFETGRPLAAADLACALEEVPRTGRVFAEEVAALRAMARNRFLPAQGDGAMPGSVC